MKTTLHIGPWTITKEQEQIHVYDDRWVPDKDWRYIDAAGHGHFWQDGYPTLRWVSLPCSMGHGDDCDAEGDYECPHCGEKIEPGTTAPSPTPTYINGPWDVSLSFDDGTERRDYVITTEADASALLKDPVEAIPRVTSGLTPVSVERRAIAGGGGGWA